MNADLERRLVELKAAGELPSPTGVALRLLELTQRDDTSTREIARAIQADPALTGRLLKFANSAYVGLGRAIVAVDDAVILLGIHVVRQLALGLSVLSNTRQGPCKDFDYLNFWSRSLATAVAAQTLCAPKRPFPPAEAFTCGLLGQVGCLALATLFPDTYGELQSTVTRPDELLRLEQSRLSTDHVELTAALLSDWGLPRVYVEAVRCHTQLNKAKAAASPRQREYRLAEILRLAAHIGRMCIAPQERRTQLLPELLELGGSQGLTANDVETLFDAAVQQWIDWGRILDVPTEDISRFAEVMEKVQQEEGHAREVEASHSGLRILVVDDDPLALRLLTRHLEKAGHQVLTAADGQQGLKLALDAKPQLVITDWMMPGIDGLALCRALREARLGQLLYIVMLTMCEDENQLVAAFEAGADDYLVKPYSQRVLEARIRGGERLIRLQEAVEREQEENRRHLEELAVMNRRLRDAALTDQLTELPNRRYAMDHLSKEWASSERTGMPLACLVLDVDHFKSFNDRCGHDVGDKVLRQTAAVLRGTARASDLACRFGGEEFVVVCTNTDERAARSVGERLRHAVESYRLDNDTCAGNVTVSVGAAIRTERMSSPDDLLKAADRALYQAKRTGRNRVCYASSRAETEAVA